MILFEEKYLQNPHNMSAKVYNHPIISAPDYEYGWQESDKFQDNKMYYIVYYDLLMVDIDSPISDISLVDSLMFTMGLTGRLYRTYNGYHVFVTSQSFHHKSPLAKKVMSVLGCDPFYVAFSVLNGFKVRLNCKDRKGETVASEYDRVVGRPDVIPEDKKLLDLLSIHDGFIEKHRKI